MLDILIEVISTWPDFIGYVDKLKRLRETFIERTRKIFVPDPKHFNTLIHGDMWAPNLMIKRDDKATIENMILIDFQFSCFTSPAIDLHNYFSNTLQVPLRIAYIDGLVEFYHEHLSKNLNKLNYSKEIPTLQQFKQQFLDKALWGKCLQISFISCP